MISNTGLNMLRPEDLLLGRRMQRFCDLLRKYDVEATALSATGVDRFVSLSFHQRDEIIRSFTDYTKIIFLAEEKGIHLRNDVDLLEHTLPLLGLTATADALEKVKDGNVIEIYSPQNIQIFRNITFMEFCGYSLLDLISFEFFELYERSSQITGKLIEAGQEVLKSSADYLDFAKIDVPGHVLRERFSGKPDQFFVTMKYLFPLYTGPNKRSALLLIEQGERVATPKTNGNLSFL